MIVEYDPHRWSMLCCNLDTESRKTKVVFHRFMSKTDAIKEKWQLPICIKSFILVLAERVRMSIEVFQHSRPNT